MEESLVFILFSVDGEFPIWKGLRYGPFHTPSLVRNVASYVQVVASGDMACIPSHTFSAVPVFMAVRGSSLGAPLAMLAVICY